MAHKRLTNKIHDSLENLISKCPSNIAVKSCLIFWLPECISAKYFLTEYNKHTVLYAIPVGLVFMLKL